MRTKHLAHLAHWSDDQLRASYHAVDQCRVKTGKNKGHITVRALRWSARLVAEAERRGAEYPYNWLSQEAAR